MRSTEVRRGNPPRVARVPGEAVDDHLTSRFALAAWRQVLRRHWLAAALLAAGLVLRVLAQFAYRPALFYIDSVKYLYTAQGNDPEGYKLPLRAILLVANLNTVVAIQHLLGLGIGVAHLRAAAAPRRVPLAGRAGHGARPAGRLSAPERADDHARYLVRGTDRRRYRDLALATGCQLAAGRSGGHCAGSVGHCRPGRRGADPGSGDLRTRRWLDQLAAGHRQGGSPVRSLRAAHSGLLHGLLPARRRLLPVASGRHVGLRQNGGRR